MQPAAMGYFSLPMAKLVRPEGKVICVDIQQKMLDVLLKRATKAGIAETIETCVVQESFSLEKYYESVDFALAFAVAHEVPDQNHFFKEKNTPFVSSIVSWVKIGFLT